MTTEARARTVGERLIELLAANGIDTVFGIPGVHTVELYRGLEAGAVRHVTPRHEQGAGFMADGYARATGRPAACLLITGPGLTNAATPMAQAMADSAPMLVVTGVSSRDDLGAGRGALHELPDQRGLGAGVSRFSQTIQSADQLEEAVARAAALFAAQRPGPVHLEIPLDLMATPAFDHPPRPTVIAPSEPSAAAIEAAAERLRTAVRPVVLVGGGAAAAPVAALAETLDAPVVQTTNARGMLGAAHPLSVPASPSLMAVRAEIAAADVVLAIGTEIGRTDYDMYDRGRLAFDGALIRVDIDAQQAHRNHAPEMALVGDAQRIVPRLTAAIGARSPGSELKDRGADRAEAMRAGAWAEIGGSYRRCVELLGAIWRGAPTARIVGDSTQAVYAGNLYVDAPGPRQWFNAATGFGALGFSLPAAIGARIADPTRPVVCLVGDGGLMFTLGEMAAAVDAGAPVIMVVWNNAAYGEIRDAMIRQGVAPAGVELYTPDFQQIARGMGWRTTVLEHRGSLESAVREAAASGASTLIELPETVALADLEPDPDPA